jgi:ADP-heptose:LPS heptosyltransferase
MSFEALGDTLLASCILESIRQLEPAPEITLFISRGNRPCIDLLGPVARVIEIPLTSPRAALRAIRSASVDVMLDIGQWPRWYAVLCAASRSRYTVGFRTAGQHRHWAYDCVVEHRRDCHELENFQALVKAGLGISAPRLPALHLPPEPRQTDRPLALPRHQAYVVFHPWAGGFRGREREWPEAHWLHLGQALLARGYHIDLSGGPGDQAQGARLAHTLEKVAIHPGQVRNIAGQVTLPALARHLQEACAVVSVNTGIMHLAALAGARTVGLHGPTSRLRWGPSGPQVQALAAEAHVPREYLHLGFEYPDTLDTSMQALTPEQVLHALEPWLAPSDLRA